MTRHETVRPTTRIRICKAGAFTIVSLMLLGVAAQGEILAVCGDGVLDGGEDCDLAGGNGAPGSCCTVGCTFQPSSSVCRVAAGPCDVAETCTGSGATCPTDDFQNPSFVCRAATGVCDIAETCTGSGTACPTDNFSASTTVCRASAGICDVAENCTGSGATCPTNGFQNPSFVCRAATGVCDIAESCTGSGATCPTDAFAAPFVTCRPAAGVCDVTESCTGSSPSCPTNVFQSPSFVCRAALGVCDAAESCTGSASSCPADVFAPSSTVCRAAAAVCDVTESCTGVTPSCPVDAFAPSSTVCRAATDVCDIAESCTGSTSPCPGNAFQPDGSACPNDGMFCNGVESCQGGMCRGTPLTCNDGIPCTEDFCDEQTQSCSSTVSPDGETAAGGDGLCDTTDDNLSLYGGDEECGTTDDLTGDGLCNQDDNCDVAFNPGQQDADHDGLGNSCDATPCLTRGLYAAGSVDLLRLDPAALTFSVVRSGLPPDMRDVAVDPTETFAAVSSFQTNAVAIIDLTDPAAPLRQLTFNRPWGIDIGASQMGYVVENTTGRIGRFDPQGNLLPPISSSLSAPIGLDVDAAELFAFVTEASGRLQRVNMQTGGSPSLVTSGLSSPQAIALNAAETSAYVIEAGTGRLSRVTISTGSITVVATGLNAAQGLALNAVETHAYVTVQGAPPGRIQQVNLSTGIVTPLDFGIAAPFIPGGAVLGPPPPVRISLADNASGSPPSSLVLPVVVDDLTGLGVLSADLTLRFNPDVVAITTIAAGSLTGACTLTTNLATPGLASISIFCTSPLSGAGSLAEITFSVSGTPGQGSPLDIATSILNEGSPAHCADDGTLFIPVEISGTILYYRNHVTGTEPSAKSVDSAIVELHGPDSNDPQMFDPNPLLTSPTDCSGAYAFMNLAPIQPYQVLARKTNDFLGAIDPFDAALNAQHVVGLTTLTSKQRLAADASGNGTLTSFDSARIAQLSVGLIAQLPVAQLNGGDWTFVPSPAVEPHQSVFLPIPSAGLPGRIEYVPISESAAGQDFHAILYGDVSGNWQPVCPGVLPPGGTAPDAAMAPRIDSSIAGVAPPTVGSSGPALILPTLAASKGQTVRVPIRARDLPAAISFYVDLRYDPSVVRLLRVENGAATATRFSLTPNIIESGRARVALFSTTPLGGSDSEIAVAVFEVVGTAGSVSRVSIAGWTVNEGQLGASVNEGTIRVLSRRNPPLQ